MKLKQDEYNVLRKLNLNPKDSQRELANKLGFSLGKLNYCIAALKKKGMIKMTQSKSKGKQKSLPCEHCQYHPTKRVYIKQSNVFKGFAWYCKVCQKFTIAE